MYVVRSDISASAQVSASAIQQALQSIVLESLEIADDKERFDRFAARDAAQAMSGEPYELLLDIAGDWKAAPRYAVYALWRVAEPENEVAFIDSRRRLFELRQHVLPTFAYDWLLKRVDQAGHFLVLGLYGDEEAAARLCREHPDIQRFGQANPASAYGASNVSGLRVFRVAEISPPV